MTFIRPFYPAFAAALLMAIVGCAGTDLRPSEGSTPVNDQESRYAARSSLFGPDGLTFSTDPSRGAVEGGGSGIGVNSFLWRATLDTIVFMPVSSADPFGGVILTDWYTPPGSPGERFKLNIYILDRQLRADGLRVAAFRQIRDSSGEWIDAPVNEQTSTALEDTILTRARELRVISTAAAQ